jgi:hypothetical protein
MVHQTAENLTVTNVLGFSSSTNLKRTPKTQAQELYVQIKDEVAYQIIKQGLSRAESKLFFYFLLLDRFGDRPVKVKVAEILHETGISKSVYHLAIAKFQKRGWFGFTHADVQISNFCTPTKKSKKQDFQSEKQDSQSKNRTLSPKNRTLSPKNRTLKSWNPYQQRFLKRLRLFRLIQTYYTLSQKSRERVLKSFV